MLGVVALFAVVLATLLGWAVLHNFDQERAAVVTRAESQARFMATVSAEAMFFRDFLTLETLVRQAVEDPGIVHAVFIDTDGSATTRFAQVDDPRVEAAMADLEVVDSRLLVDALARQDSIGVVQVPIISENVRLGEAHLVYSVEEARNAAWSFLFDAALVAIVALGLIMLLTVVVYRRGIQRPLDHLTTRVELLAAGNFTEAPDVTRGDEIGALEQAFNEMARELSVTLGGLKRARDEAERADRAKSEFLANMSHEIRTPLNAVLGFADVLLDSDLTVDQRELLTTMHSSGEGLLALLNQILDFSKLEHSGSELDLQPFDLAMLVSDVVGLFSAEADRKQIRLIYEIEPGCPSVVRGDHGQIRQVLVNLLGNAVKFTGRGSVEIRVAPGEGIDRIRFDVIDSGIGIDPDLVDELFEPFRQGDSTTTRRFGGTGLGLTICERLVSAMGGHISGVGNAGDGSTFSFTLPLVAAEFEDAEAPHPDPVVAISADEHPLRILLAEDNEPNRMVAVRMLSRLGYQIDVARDGAEAVDMALSSSYDLILMDIQMPHIDGIESARQIRAGHTGRRRPRIVAFTAHALEGDGEGFLQAGMDGFLAKPLRINELTAVLASTVSTHSTPSPLEVPADPAPTSTSSDRPSPSGRDDTPNGVFDRDELDRLFGDDAADLLIELVPVFRADADHQISTMRDALAAGDADALWKSAHTLKGSASSLAATRIAEWSDQLERLGKAGQIDAAPELLERVANELALIS